MLNDRSSILSLLETRRSGKPRELAGPGPTAAELERILTIAVRVPDHGKLTPWRLVLIGDDQRDELAQLLHRALAEEDLDAGSAHHAAEDEFAHYAGQLVVLISAPVENHKIPIWEQQLSCGTVGMNLLLAAHALGYVAGWVTGRVLQCGRADRGVHIHRSSQPRAGGPPAAIARRRRAQVAAADPLILRLNFDSF